VRAQELAPLLRETLARWNDACKPGRFDPHVSEREFRIVAGSYVGEMLLPDIIATIERHSPMIKLRVWNLNSHIGEWLDASLVDLAIGSFEQLPRRVKSQVLFRHNYVWIARRGHPTAFELTTVEDVLRLPRLELDAGEGPVNSKGIWHEGGIRRRAVADAHAALRIADRDDVHTTRYSIHQWRVALEIVGRTDLVAFAPERLFRFGKPGDDIAVLEQFAPAFVSELSVIWDETQASDPGNRWLRDVIIEVASRQDQSSQ
jgi:DNA-binding transcriptional LysR family regulator